MYGLEAMVIFVVVVVHRQPVSQGIVFGNLSKKFAPQFIPEIGSANAIMPCITTKPKEKNLR